MASKLNPPSEAKLTINRPYPPPEAKLALDRATSWPLDTKKHLGYAVTTSAELVSVPASNGVSAVTAIRASTTGISSRSDRGVPNQKFTHSPFNSEGSDFEHFDFEHFGLEHFDSEVFDSRDPLPCPYRGCQQKFGGDRRCQKGNLNRHVDSLHKKRKTFHCSAGCGRVYKRKDTLQMHERSHPQLKRKPPIARRRKNSHDSSNSEEKNVILLPGEDQEGD